MIVMVDIAHPHHFLFYRSISENLMSLGHQVVLATRDKDVTQALVEASGLTYVCVSQKRGKGWLWDISEGVTRIFRLIRLMVTLRPNVVLTSNPTGSVAAKLICVPSVFDTMDGDSHGLHYLIPARISSLVTFPLLLGLEETSRFLGYEALKSMSHAVSNADDTKRLFCHLRIPPTATVAVLRVSAYSASHDHGASGLTVGLVQDLLSLLRTRFDNVVVSVEGGLEVDDPISIWLQKNPGTFHRFLERADLVVGDSVTVAEEAVILGTPSIWISEFAMDRPIAKELEARFRVTRNILLKGEDETRSAVYAAMNELMSADGRSGFLHGRRELMNSSIDVVQWYSDLIVKKFA